MHKRYRADVVIAHGCRNSPGHEPSLSWSISGDGRPHQSFQAAAVGALPQTFGLGRYREFPSVEPHVKRVSKAEASRNLGNASVQAESPASICLDASIIEMQPVCFTTVAELPEDGFQRQEQIFCFGVRASGDVRPAVIDRLPERGHTLWIVQCLVLECLGRHHERDGDRTLKRAREHSFLHRGIDQAQVDQICINRVIPFPRLRQVFKRGPEPVDGPRPIADSPLVSSRKQLARQALVIDRVRVPHGDRQIAKNPAHRAERQKITRRSGHPLAFNQIRGLVGSEPPPDLGDQRSPVCPRFQQHAP